MGKLNIPGLEVNCKMLDSVASVADVEVTDKKELLKYLLLRQLTEEEMAEYIAVEILKEK